MFCMKWKWKVRISALVVVLLLSLVYHLIPTEPSYLSVDILKTIFRDLRNSQIDNKLIQTKHNIDETSVSYIRTNYQDYPYITNYTVVGDNIYFIYTAHGEKSTRDKHWSFIVFQGWEVVDQAINVTYICCFKYQNGSIGTSAFSKRRPFKFKASLMAKQIICDIKENKRPEFATLVLEKSHCNNNAPFYRPIYTEMVKEPKFAIDAQVVYGQKNASQIIEFMEYHLYFGANPIIIYQYWDLNEEARKVLQYYDGRGDLQVISLPEFPLLDRYYRKINDVTLQMINDQQVSNFDAMQRLRPYKYFTIMDTDEFIEPGNNITDLIELMDTLNEKHINTAYFRMFSEIHFLNWEPTNNNSRLMIDRYGYHTQPTKFAAKNLFISERIVPGTIWIHGAGTKEGYKMKDIVRGNAVLKHFRLCKQNWVDLRKRKNEQKANCEDNFRKIRGHFMERIADQITQNVLRVKQSVGIP